MFIYKDLNLDKQMSIAYHDLTWSTTAAKSSELDAHYEGISSNCSFNFLKYKYELNLRKFLVF